MLEYIKNADCMFMQSAFTSLIRRLLPFRTAALRRAQSRKAVAHLLWRAAPVLAHGVTPKACQGKPHGAPGTTDLARSISKFLDIFLFASAAVASQQFLPELIVVAAGFDRQRHRDTPAEQ